MKLFITNQYKYLVLTLLTAGATYLAPATSTSTPSETMAEAKPDSRFRFHCEKDTAEISEMLATLAPMRDEPINHIVMATAKMLEGRPYVGHTLEGIPERLTINIDQLDCVTFVENCFAMAMTVRDGGLSWRQFARNIESLRYRGAVQKDYDTRLHYTTDWIGDNIYRGHITDITPTLPDHRSVLKSLNFMTRNRELYPALANDSIYDRCRDIEAGFRSIRIPYMTKEAAYQKNVVEMLQDGDMISFVSKKDGLDSSHVALLRIENGKPYMMHASLKAGKVIFEKAPLFDYFKYSKRDSPGWRVVRLK